MSKLLTKSQLAELLQVAEITIDTWRKKGLPAIKIGRAVRFDEKAVFDWIQEQQDKK